AGDIAADDALEAWLVNQHGTQIVHLDLRDGTTRMPVALWRQQAPFDTGVAAVETKNHGFVLLVLLIANVKKPRRWRWSAGRLPFPAAARHWRRHHGRCPAPGRRR